MPRNYKDPKEIYFRGREKLIRLTSAYTELYDKLAAQASKYHDILPPNPFKITADMIANGGRAGPPVRPVGADGKKVITDEQAHETWKVWQRDGNTRAIGGGAYQKLVNWQAARQEAGLPEIPEEWRTGG